MAENGAVEEPPVPEFDWQTLNEQTQIGVANGRAVVVLFTVQAEADDGSEWLEFTWLPTEEPGNVDVLFGLGHLSSTRWDNARRAAEREYVRWTERRKPPP